MPRKGLLRLTEGKPLYILKLGGSVITDKKSNKAVVNSALLRQISKAIASSKKAQNFGLVIVHGAGPFGHKPVKEYGIEDGFRDEKSIEGFVRTHSSMETLNKEVVSSLQEAGLNALPIQPSACIIQQRKKIVSFNTEIISSLLSLGIVPVLYGDVAIDNALGFSVVSGDAIIAHLANGLNAGKIFFGTDVEGIYDSDPKKDSKARLIELITDHNFEQVFSRTSGSTAIDVTMGMKGKLSEIREKIRGRECFVFLLNPKNVSGLLEGKSINCTKIYF